MCIPGVVTTAASGKPLPIPLAIITVHKKISDMEANK